MVAGVFTKSTYLGFIDGALQFQIETLCRIPKLSAPRRLAPHPRRAHGAAALNSDLSGAPFPIGCANLVPLDFSRL